MRALAGGATLIVLFLIMNHNAAQGGKAYHHLWLQSVHLVLFVGFIVFVIAALTRRGGGGK